MDKKIIIGIDASNIKEGGGLTHLIEILSNLDNDKNKIKKIIIWSSQQTLKYLPTNDLFVKISPRQLNNGFIQQVIWQLFYLKKNLHFYKCDILFVPGGTAVTSFKPVVVMCQNMLPFDYREIKKYKFHLRYFKLILLSILQLRTFKSSEGIIFLSNYAKKKIFNLIPNKYINHITIPHGINIRFKNIPKKLAENYKFTNNNPCKLLYVSTIDFYKNHLNVARAVKKLRDKGYSIELILAGSSYPPAKRQLDKYIKLLGNDNVWIKYLNNVKYDELHELYKVADIGIFASSCENLPNIILEMMASGLPICSSKSGPMFEVLENSCLYFDHDNVNQISDNIELYLNSSELQNTKAKKAFEMSNKYSWKKCSEDTFDFLYSVVGKYEK